MFGLNGEARFEHRDECAELVAAILGQVAGAVACEA
jgi:hypothetical protein